MSNLAETMQPQLSDEVSILARIWEQDDVWNVSAFDLPVVASGKTMGEAQQNFEDAISTHFSALSTLHRIEDTMKQLRGLASERDFYEARITPHVTVQNFPFSPDCALGAHAGA